jgi:hypothetical protein
MALESLVYVEVENEVAYLCENNRLESCESLEASHGEKYYGHYAGLLCFPRGAKTNALKYPECAKVHPVERSERNHCFRR